MGDIKVYRDYKDYTFYFNRYNDWQDFMSVGNAAVIKANKEFPNQMYIYELPAQRVVKVRKVLKVLQIGGVPNPMNKTDWLRDDSNTIEKFDKGFYTKFLQSDLLDNVILAFDEILDNIDMGGSFEKSKLIITDRTQGIFDFGLASLGLFEKVEFYSNKLAIDNPLEFFTEEVAGIVPAINVIKNKLEQYIYTSEESGIKYFLTKQNKGTQAALNDGYSLDDIPLKYKSFGTRQKKSYLMFKKKSGKVKKVDLYVGVGGLSDMDSTGMLQRALPMFMAAEFFESVGIRTRINSSRMFENTESINILNYVKSKETSRLTPEQNKIINCSTVVIKDFGEGLDFTRLSVAVADERTFRYNLWKLMPSINAIDFGVGMSGWGRTVYGDDIMFETAERYKNWYREQIDKGNKEWIKLDKPLMIFGGVPNPQNSWTYNGDKNESGYKDIVKEFYRILDIVDFTYNKTEKAAQRIYTRQVEVDGKDKYEYTKYVLDIFGQAFGVAEGGMYPDPKVEIDEKDINFEEKIKELNLFLAEKYLI